jgi:hypothetical protein
MWMVDPALLCRKHLLGAHVEIHMAVASINKGKSIQGHVRRGQLDASLMRQEHDALAFEMRCRGYEHNSPLPKFAPRLEDCGHINGNANVWELSGRCPDCRERIAKAGVLPKGVEK